MTFVIKALVTGYCSCKELVERVHSKGGVVLSVGGVNVDEDFNLVTKLNVEMFMVDEGNLEDARVEFCRKFPGCDVLFE